MPGIKSHLLLINSGEDERHCKEYLSQNLRIWDNQLWDGLEWKKCQDLNAFISASLALPTPFSPTAFLLLHMATLYIAMAALMKQPFKMFSNKEDRTSISDFLLGTPVRRLPEFAIPLTVGIAFLLLWNEVPQI